ncbi:MAG: hypothetical protein AAB478_02140 [Patescibacteria group bacterium]
MNEGAIDKLPLKDYETKPREIINFVGERSGIRLIDYKDYRDMKRMRTIEEHLPEEFGGAAESDKELIQQTRDGRPDSPKNDAQYVFGVAGLNGVEDKEVGELQGWISFDANEDTDILVKRGMIPQPDPNTHVLEIMYAKRPKAAPGQMTSALRQACLRIAQMDAVRNTHDPEAFKPHKKPDPDFVSPQLVITASIKSDNIDSRRMVEAAGFVDHGPISFYNKKEFIRNMSWTGRN